jgi:hypothetical protein
MPKADKYDTRKRRKKKFRLISLMNMHAKNPQQNPTKSNATAHLKGYSP